MRRWASNLTSFALCARSALHFVLFTNLVRTQAYSYSLAQIAERDPYRHQWRYIASSEQPSHTSHKHFNHSKAQSRAANNPSLYSHFAFFIIQSNPISATNKKRTFVYRQRCVFSYFRHILGQNKAKSRKNTQNHTLQWSSGLPQRYFYARSSAKNHITFCCSLLK